MRLKNVPGAREAVEASAFCFCEPEKNKGKWHEIFGNDHPVRIEVGMGKGRFIMDLARLNPDVNYLGIEKYSSVLYRGLQKLEEEPLENLRFIRMDAEYIEDVFERDEIDRIYLNFSDPWPKDRHAKRRLTSRQFLARYDKFLVPDGVVEFKTDNRALFEFSLEETKEANWEILAKTYDLHAHEELNRGNIMTEYEEKFSKNNVRINKMIIRR